MPKSGYSSNQYIGVRDLSIAVLIMDIYSKCDLRTRTVINFPKPHIQIDYRVRSRFDYQLGRLNSSILHSFIVINVN